MLTAPIFWTPLNIQESHCDIFSNIDSIQTKRIWLICRIPLRSVIVRVMPSRWILDAVYLFGFLENLLLNRQPLYFLGSMELILYLYCQYLIKENAKKKTIHKQNYIWCDVLFTITIYIGFRNIVWPCGESGSKLNSKFNSIIAFLLFSMAAVSKDMNCCWVIKKTCFRNLVIRLDIVCNSFSLYSLSLVWIHTFPPTASESLRNHCAQHNEMWNWPKQITQNREHRKTFKTRERMKCCDLLECRLVGWKITWFELSTMFNACFSLQSKRLFLMSYRRIKIAQ